MVYFTSEMNTAEVIHLVKHVDTNVFCLWQEQKGKDLFGMVKDTSYEFFIVACSLPTVQQMAFLTHAQLSQKLREGDVRVICGNEQATD